MINRVPTILYVEDEESDRELMALAFRKERLTERLQMVTHGRAAIDYLAGIGVYAQRQQYPLPAMVLLDLNLPEVHGFDVLRWIRAHPELAALPVVVFSSSQRQADKDRARELGANEFMQKPNSPGLFREVARQLNQKWLSPG